MNNSNILSIANNSIGHNKLSMSIKQEMEDEIDHTSKSGATFKMSHSRTSKADKDLLQNAMSNGQSLSLTEAGKLVVNSWKGQQQPSGTNSSPTTTITGGGGNNTKKYVAIQCYPQNSSQPNIVLVSNSNQSSGIKSNDMTQSFKIINNKKISELKNAKTIQMPFFKTNGPQPVIKKVVIQNQQNVIQGKDDEIKKLNEELKKLKQELEEYKGLIISKDLEIEKLKKASASNNSNTTTDN